MPTECELKLVASPEDLVRLAESPLLVDRRLTPERSEHLESVYFDTADGRLAERHLALRVRHANGRYVQTLKRGGGIVRGEWETTVESGQPDPAPLFLMAEERDLIDLPAAELRPILASRVDRRLQQIVVDGGDRDHRIEVALDLGDLEAETRKAPIAELELELLEGDPAALYALALDLDEQVPVRLEPLSKAARGEMLRTGTPPAPHKARRIELSEGATVDQAIAGVFGACFTQWLDNQAAALDGRDSEGVHQLRVGLRRLRSAFALFKDALPPDRLAGFKEDARAVLKSLGTARDLDVLDESLIRPLRQLRPDDRGLEELAMRLDTARRHAYESEVRPGLTSRAYTRFQLDFGGWVARHGWREGPSPELVEVQDQPIVTFAAALLDERVKAVRQRGKGFKQLNAGDRHQLRIAIKKLRYALDFSRSLFPAKPVKAMLDTLGDLQDGLGASNDLAVAHERLRTLADSRRVADARRLAEATGFVLGWHTARSMSDEKGLAKLWKTFKSEPLAWHAG